jgi:hypothetical protein
MSPAPQPRARPEPVPAVPPAGTVGNGAAAVFGVVLLLVFFACCGGFTNSDRQDDSPTKTDAVRSGRRPPVAESPRGGGPSSPREGALKTDDGGKVPVAISEEAHRRSTRLAVAKDQIGWAQMILAGQVLLVPSGTKVVVIDRGFFLSEVRVMEGQYFGWSVWADNEFLKSR